MKKIIILLIGCILCILITLFAQKNNQLYKQWYTQANKLYKLDSPTKNTDSISLSLFLQTITEALDNNKPLAVECFIKAGNIHQGYQRFTQANLLYHQALQLNNAYVKDAAATYEAYLYLGSSLYFSNVIDSAQYYFEAASEIALDNKKGKELPELGRLYNSLGAIYFEASNYTQAKNYFERAITVLSKNDTDYEEEFTGMKSNIGNCLMKLNQYDSALKIFKSLSPTAQQKNIIRQNTAKTYFEQGYYDSALAIYEALPLQNNFSSLLVLTDMGRIYMNRKQWQKAEIIFDSAISRNKSISAVIKNKEEATAYFYRSQLAEEQGLIDEAIIWNNQALAEVHLNFKWTSITDLPEDVSKTVSPITLFNILRSKAVLLTKKYNLLKEKPLLFAAVAAFKKTIETANYIKNNFDNDEAKLFFTNNYRQLYNEALRAAYVASEINDKYKDDFFFILENYKGNILYQNLQSVKIKSTANASDSTWKREKEIKQLLAIYTTRINQNTSEKEAIELQKKLLSLQVELSRLQKKYEKDNAYNFYKSEVNGNIHSISQIQSKINNNTALLNYYVDDSAIYCLVLKKKKVSINKLNKDTSFKSTFKQFINETYHYEEGKRYKGFAASAKLYQYLIKPLEPAIKNCENLVIIPDESLYYIPFEALITNEQDKDYLMLSKTISYHYSFLLLMEESEHHSSNKTNNKLVAFTPYLQSDSNIKLSLLPELPLSEAELKGITNNIYSGKKATKKNFLTLSAQYPIVHLATHASAGTDSSTNWIQFYPNDGFDVNNKLHVPEIYNMDFHNAELVILSACETGGGTSMAGEGLLSLSRAFMYSGADGIVSTLWKTEDKVTAFLMQRMHIYLKQNLSPAKALQLAKKDLLMSKEIGSQYKTPNYWSNFTYTGKINLNADKRINWWWYIGSGLLLLVLSFYFITKKKRLPIKNRKPLNKTFY